jgi:hypothetical protein
LGTFAASGSASKKSRLRTRAARDEHVWEGRDGGVVVEHGGVVVLARERDLVLGRGQLLLELEDVLVGLELGIVLDDGEQRAQRAGQRVLGGGLLAGPWRRRRRRGAGVGDVGQDLLLEAHVALDGVHEVRDQVVAALELDLDLGEGLVDPQARWTRPL